MKSTPREMLRIKDGVVLPYSATLVKAHPGEFAPVRWDAAAKKYVRDGDAPLTPPPAPPPPQGGFVDDDDDDERPADYVDPEPETAPEEEPAAAPKRRSRKAAQ